VSLKAIEIVQADCLDVLKNRSDKLSKLRGSTLVVTGGTGFVGTWITELVACLNDHFSFGIQLLLISRRTEEFSKRCPHLSNRKDVSLQSTDVRYLTDLPKSTRWVIHAAGTPDARFHSSHPVETMMSTADGVATVLRAAERCSDFQMLLNVSSGLVYGAQPFDLERIPESYAGSVACGSASSAYADAKRFAETLCAAARSQARIPLLSVRPFAFVGPYQSLDSPWAVNNFIKDAIQGHSIRVLGDGQTLRSYLYASDMAYWLLRILTGGEQGQTYNMGSPEAVSLSVLAEKVSSFFTPAPAVVLRAGHTPTVSRSKFVPDTSKAKQNLGLDVTVSLDAALNKTIQWNKYLKTNTH
jgi:nucleoside-diphosphate-sugar epimerase